MEKKQFQISDNEGDSRLDRWFKKKFPDVTHSFLQKMLRQGKIRVNGKKAKSNARINSGDLVEVVSFKHIEIPKKISKKNEEVKITPYDIEKLRQNIIYKNDDVIIINKEPGLATQGGSGVGLNVDAMLFHLKKEGEERPKLVHRIDKDTSGILVIAKNTVTARTLTKMFKDKEVEKTYWAVVVGIPEIRQGKIDIPIMSKKFNGKIEKSTVDEEAGSKAVTYYKVLDNAKVVSFVELNPATGRMHQLRVHMAHIGHPVLGDGKYGGKEAFVEGLGERMHLHSRKVSFTLNGKKISAVAPIPKHMHETFKMFQFEVDR